MLFALFTLGSCNKNEFSEYAGTYNLYYMEGDLSLNNFDYYRITLEADGDCIIESKSKFNSQQYQAKATFEIKDNKIHIYSKNGGVTVTEIYDYINEEIHMLNQTIDGISFSAKFTKKILL